MAPRRRDAPARPSTPPKDSPDDVHATLRRRASASGRSLQAYQPDRLTADARSPTLEEVLARAGGRAGGNLPLAVAVDAVRADRNVR